MTRQSPKPQRCAIYTRKSTDHNLDLSFNSLHAQREACEAYIKSQAHEGWTLVQEAFDDGAFSGASLERPALQALLNHVKARQVDIIIVYKVDRLTRSLADFAKLVELFDAYQVSFVSITQSFNTTSSMGRLTLNVLLSFAQFEREVIGERVRDKIAASKRKGLWVGGPVPLGYRSINKALQIAPEEASLVRLIFSTYLQCSSISALACFLNDKGIRPKDRHLVNSTVIKTDHFRVGPLAYLLNNRFYIGEITYRGEIYQGQHDAIIRLLPARSDQAEQSACSMARFLMIVAMRCRQPMPIRRAFAIAITPARPYYRATKWMRDLCRASRLLTLKQPFSTTCAPNSRQTLISQIKNWLISIFNGLMSKKIT